MRAIITLAVASIAITFYSAASQACMGPNSSMWLSPVTSLAAKMPLGKHPLALKVGLGDGSPGFPGQSFGRCTSCGCSSQIGALRGELLKAATKGNSSIVLIGEVHDNELHHRIRAALLGLYPDEDMQPWSALLGPIAFEQIRADQQLALDAFAALPPQTRTTADLTRLLDWDKSPWSKTSNYTPLFDAAVASRLPILAADPPRDAIRAAAKSGPSALPADERTRLGLDTPLSDAQNAASLAELEASHCGAIPKSAHPNMAFAQRYRDAHMADALINAAAKNGSAVLIAGNGHVRADRGVPWYLHQRAPDKKVISVLVIEVEDGKNDPADYVERDETGKPAADYIVFTPRAARDKDPCDELKSKAPKN